MNLDAPHLHLMVNHLPVLGVPFAVALGLFGVLRKQDVLLRAALVTLAVAGACAVVTARTGEAAEEIVEELPGVSHDRIHEHEEAAEWATRAAAGVGLLALVVLFVGRGKALHRGAVIATFALALLLAGWLGYTANLGGEIRHPEIRTDATAADFAVEADEDDGRQGRGRGRGRGRGGDDG